jgi:cytochrome bd ubiquinol oxidase subunit II
LLWRQAWDAAFAVASTLLALFFGAALGNLVRGLPIAEDGAFFEPLWTDFRVGEATGILDWFTVLVGVTACTALLEHGALWLALKTSGAIRERACRVARRVWPALVVLTLLTTLASASVQPRLVTNLSRYPLGLVCPLLAVGGLIAMRLFAPRSALRAFLASGGFVLGLIGSAAFAIFPHALSARVAGRELTIAAAAADAGTLTGMLWWWLPGMALASAYSFFIYSKMPKVFTTGGEEH